MSEIYQYQPGGFALIRLRRYRDAKGKMTMRTYEGDRTIDGISVTVDGKPLDERFDIKTISPGGFDWSFEGAASAQLALALLADHLQDASAAIALHDGFMREIVANLANEWVLTSEDISAAVAVLQKSA